MFLLIQYSLKISLSTSSLATNLSILGNCVAITSRLYFFFIIFNNMILKESYRTFVKSFCHGVP